MTDNRGQQCPPVILIWQEDHRVSLGYIMRPYLKRKSKKEEGDGERKGKEW